MGTTLTGTTPQDTYDSLIKVTDNGPLTGSLKVLTDGLGNNSAISLSTAAASVTGTLAVSSTIAATNSVTVTGADTLGTNVGIVNTSAGGVNYNIFSCGSSGTLAPAGSLAFRDSTTGATRLVISSAGNVGIGTTAPAKNLEVSASTDATLRLNSASSAVTSSDILGAVEFFANDSSADGTGIAASINASPDNAFGQGGMLRFNTRLTNAANAIERMRITNEGYVRLATGGIQFNGDTAAANALDDYEEGTWTMGIAFDGASVGLTYSTQAGTYTKIGRQVTLNGRISLSAKGSSTGEARITGLPFTIANTEGNRSVPALRFANITFANQFQGFGVNNTTQILLQEITEAGTDSVLTDADFANNSEIFICFTYFV